MPIFLIIGSLLLASCGAGQADLTPTATFGPDEIRTQAVETFSINLTETALAAPSDTPMPTDTPAPTLPALPTSTAGTLLGAATTASNSTTSCYGLTFVKDVSIPDDTEMTPGKSFTKTWKVLNSGSCAWDSGFKFAFVGGDSMSGSTLTLTSSVASGAQYDLSVPMVAPTDSDTYRGNWRMSTSTGEYFGDEIYVQIVVGGSGPTNTPAPATSTSAPTDTPTP